MEPPQLPFRIDIPKEWPGGPEPNLPPRTGIGKIV